MKNGSGISKKRRKERNEGEGRRRESNVLYSPSRRQGRTGVA